MWEGREEDNGPAREFAASGSSFEIPDGAASKPVGKRVFDLETSPTVPVFNAFSSIRFPAEAGRLGFCGYCALRRLQAERKKIMPYVTLKQPLGYRQISFEDMFSDSLDLSRYVLPNVSNTRTHFAERIPPKLAESVDVPAQIAAFRAFNQKHDALFAADRKSLYRSFPISKRTGGLRRINAPNEALSDALYELKDLLEATPFALHHTTAFAYVRRRDHIAALRRHQERKNRWFLKLDFTDFFGSTSHEFLLKILSEIFPFSELLQYPEGKKQLSKALDLCFLNGGLPQGTPISPMLTNLTMLPIDHRLSNTLREFEGNKFVYTRYADDIIISCRGVFDWRRVQRFVVDTLAEFGAPLRINRKKTHYGNSAGANWNLGLMLNKNNEITVGHRKKKQFEAMLHGYVSDKRGGKSWPLRDVQTLNGLYSYYRKVEPARIDAIVAACGKKNGVNVMGLIRRDLKGIPSIPAAA
jgi:hypothetical protein